MIIQSSNEIINDKKKFVESIIQSILKNEEEGSELISNIISKNSSLMKEYLNKLLSIALEIEKIAKEERNNMSISLNQSLRTLLESDSFKQINYEEYDISKDEKNKHYSPIFLEQKKRKKSASQNILPINTNLNNSFNPSKDINENKQVQDHKRDCELLEEMFCTLLANKSIEHYQEKYKKFLVIIHYNYSKIHINKIFLSITQPIWLNKVKVFDSLSIMFHYFLNSLMATKDNHNIIFLNTLIVSKIIFLKDTESKDTSLFEKLKDHTIWKEYDRWAKTVNELIKIKLDEYKLNFEQKLAIKVNNSDKESKKAGIISNIVSFFSNKNSELNDYENGKKNIIFDTLMIFSYYLSIINFPESIAFRIINMFATKYVLSSNKISELFIEFASQKNESCYNERIQLKTSQKKVFNRFSILKNVIKYISNKIVLRNFLILSKETNKIVMKKVFTQVLIYLKIKLNLSQRAKIWETILEISSCKISCYEMTKLQSEKTKSEIKAYEEIVLDVHRSFNTKKNVSHQSMINVLRSFALYDKVIEYCQGMNFLVGYLLYIFEDEEKCFKILCILVQKYSLKKMLQEGMPLLTKSFFILDKLILIYNPKLYEYFRMEGINASHFSSPWLVTLFSCAFHYSQGLEPPILLYSIWDIFFLKGWKGLYICALTILNEVSNNIIGEKFDSGMIYLNSILKGPLFNSEEFAIKIKEAITDIKYKGKITDKLDEEYEILKKEPKRLQEDPDEIVKGRSLLKCFAN